MLCNSVRLCSVASVINCSPSAALELLGVRVLWGGRPSTFWPVVPRRLSLFLPKSRDEFRMAERLTRYR